MNASNFSDALRVSTVAAADVVFPTYLIDRIKVNAQILPAKVPDKGGLLAEAAASEDGRSTCNPHGRMAILFSHCSKPPPLLIRL